ncbi:MAG: hypothetical protein FWH57_09425 [Oscillospiraceae bacterium]|nr:hypothetical protein [Oscillospiraceae bacterium]
MFKPEIFLESKEMLEFTMEHYKDRPLEWCEIIAASRASIQDKAEALLEISQLYPANEFFDPKRMADAAFAAIEETRNIPVGSVFLLSSNWRDNDDWNYEYGTTDLPFARFEQALNYIKRISLMTTGSV